MRTTPLLLTLLLALVLLPASARGSTIAVTSAADPGDGSCATGGCTLREALTQANASPDVDRIEVRLPVLQPRIVLESALPAITSSVDVFGIGRQRPVLDASKLVFQHGLLFAPTTTGSWRVERLHVTGAGRSGLAVSKGRLEVVDCVLDGNGGENSIGGGISAADGSRLTVRRSQVLNNVGWFGGGISSGDELLLEGSLVAGNQARELGGGVRAEGEVRIAGSTISGNVGKNDGGLAVQGTSVDLSDVTVTANRLANPQDTGPAGARLTGDVVTVRNTVIAGNGEDSAAKDLAGPGIGHVLLVHAFIGTSTGGVQRQPGAPSTLGGGDPKLDALGANGGPMSTHLPRPGSPLIDAGASARTADQRGAASPLDDPAVANPGDGSDIGAVEAPLPPPAPPAPPAAAPQPAQGDPPAPPASGPAPAPAAAAPAAPAGGASSPAPTARGFGRTPGVALRLLDARPSRSGVLRVRLRNTNAFAVRATITVRARRGGRRTVRAAARTVKAGASTTIRVVVPKALRRRPLRVGATLTDPSGARRTVTVRR